MMNGSMLLQDLNEDCLWEIFSITSLDLMDLCSLYNTCKQFQPFVQRMVKDLSIVAVSKRRYTIESGNRIERHNAEDAKTIFRNFGPIVSTISIDTLCSRDNSFLINLLTTDPKTHWESLTIKNIKIPEQLVHEIKPIRKGLKKLQLIDVSFTEDPTNLYAGMDSLIELRIDWTGNCGGVLKNVFPKLERFCYRNTNNKHGESWPALPTFLSRHKKLKSLALGFNCGNSIKKKIPRVIGRFCKKLEELTILCGGNMIPSSRLQPIQQLHYLKALTLMRVSFFDFGCFAMQKELRELTLLGCHLPDDYSQFAVFHRLEKLNIFGCLSKNSAYIVGIIDQLTNLIELDFSWSTGVFVLDEKTYWEIVAVANGRKNVLTLNCMANFKVKSLPQNRNVRLSPLVASKNCIR